MRNNIRDFWFIVLLVYGIVGLTFVRAQEDGLKKSLTLLNEGKTEEAISILRHEVEKNPQAPDVHLAMGVVYLERNDFELANSYLEKALQLDPNSVPTRYSLAMLYEKKRQYPMALAEWKKVFELSSDADLKELARKHIRHLEQ